MKKDRGGWRPVDLAFHERSPQAVRFILKNLSIEDVKLKRKRSHSYLERFLRKYFGHSLSYWGFKDYFQLDNIERFQSIFCRAYPTLTFSIKFCYASFSFSSSAAELHLTESQPALG